MSEPRGQAVRVAACQMAPRLWDVRANLDVIAAMARQAAGEGARLAVFPECCTCGYGVGDDAVRMAGYAEPLLGAERGVTVRRLEELAAELGLALVVGMPEGAGGAVYNALVFVHPVHGAAGAFRKVHLWDRDGDAFAAGARFVTWELPPFTLGPLVCYDLEFPEAARSAALLGADLLVAGSANAQPWADEQRVYVRARALENAAFAVLTNCAGASGGERFCGGSAVVSPRGEVLAQAGADESVIIADLHHGQVAAARTSPWYLEARRPAAYGRSPARPDPEEDPWT